MQHTQDLTVAAAYASGIPHAQQRHASSAGRSQRNRPGELLQLQTPAYPIPYACRGVNTQHFVSSLPLAERLYSSHKRPTIVYCLHTCDMLVLQQADDLQAHLQAPHPMR